METTSNFVTINTLPQGTQQSDNVARYEQGQPSIQNQAGDTQQFTGVCPGCGRCPYCGRGWNVQPYWYWQPQPYWQYTPYSNPYITYTSQTNAFPIQSIN